MSDLLGRAVEPFVYHDIRRTVRTQLSALRVDETVAELVIGHALPGLVGVYNQWQALDARREALQRWGARLEEIVRRSFPYAWSRTSPAASFGVPFSLTPAWTTRPAELAG